MPLVQVTSECVPNVASVDHSSGDDTYIFSLENDASISSMVFNNSKLSIEAMKPNNASDVTLRVTPLQYIDIFIDNSKYKGCVTLDD